jgi:hypothetical protein
MKNIFIISARRSGTHLLTDLIVNNFNYKRIDNKIDYDFLTNENVEQFIEEMLLGSKLAWSHCHDFDSLFIKNINHEKVKILKKLFLNSKIIFIYRDIKDTVTSHYYRPINQKRYKSFNDYFNNHNMYDYTAITNYSENHNNIFEILKAQHKNWFSVFLSKEILTIDMEIISYEEIILNYESSVDKLSYFLNIKINDIKDVRLKSKLNKNNNILYTYNDFRSGNIGDWVNVLDSKKAEEIDRFYSSNMFYHVKAYINNPETEKFQIKSKDWKLINVKVTKELKKYNKFFDEFKRKINIQELINNRYYICDRKLDDVRYIHKVFFYNNYVLKYLIPSKCLLDNNTYNEVIPIASKVNLLTIFKTHQLLHDLGIMPKLYYAGLHDDFLIVIQEKIESNNNSLYLNFNNWLMQKNTFPIMLDQIKLALDHNILLVDYINPHNLFIDNKCNCIKYVDLDGIIIFNDFSEIIESLEFKGMLNKIHEIDLNWESEFGYSLLNNNQNYELFRV